MKKFTLIFVTILTIGALNAQDEVIVGWTFPGNSAVADTGLAVNLDKEITTMGGTSDIQFKNGFETKAAQATGWDEGMDTKAWVVSFSTEGYSDLTISSRQTSGGNEPGPKDFKIQFSVDAGENWLDISGSDIEVENDWETSFINNLELPDECEDQEELMIRWIMTSNESSGAGGNVLETGKSKIDDIYIKGEVVNSLNEHLNYSLSIGPNPATDFIYIKTDFVIENLILSDLSGKKIIEETNFGSLGTLDISTISAGIFILTIKNYHNKVVRIRKVVVE